MIPLTVTPNLDLDPWTDLAADPAVRRGAHGDIERVGLLPNGTESGRACVEFLIRMPDGSLVTAETTLRLFRMTAAALLASPVAELDEP